MTDTEVRNFSNNATPLYISTELNDSDTSNTISVSDTRSGSIVDGADYGWPEPPFFANIEIRTANAEMVHIDSKSGSGDTTQYQITRGSALGDIQYGSYPKTHASNSSIIPSFSAADAYRVSGGGGSVGSSIDIQTFGSDFFNSSSVGDNTWIKPDSARIVEVWICGSGGGGASGRVSNIATAASGGSGGSAGELIHAILDPSQLSSSETVHFSAGGPRGDEQFANDSNGNNGTDGDITTFGTYLTARGGIGGIGGTTTTAAAQSLAPENNAPGSQGASGAGTATTGGAPTIDTPGAGVPGYIAPMGGGGGGGYGVGYSAAGDGGDGRPAGVDPFGSAIENRGGMSLGDGLEAGDMTTGTIVPCRTGGGGGAVFGHGGGGAFGSGGGGGGAGENDGSGSGRGGPGGDGWAVIITYGGA